MERSKEVGGRERPQIGGWGGGKKRLDLLGVRGRQVVGKRRKGRVEVAGLKNQKGLSFFFTPSYFSYLKPSMTTTLG